MFLGRFRGASGPEAGARMAVFQATLYALTIITFHLSFHRKRRASFTPTPSTESEQGLESRLPNETREDVNVPR